MKIDGFIGQPQQCPCHQSFLRACQGQWQLYSPGLRPTRMEGGGCPAFSKCWVSGTTAIFWRRRNKINLAASGDRQDCQWDEEMLGQRQREILSPSGKFHGNCCTGTSTFPGLISVTYQSLAPYSGFPSNLSDVSHLLQLLPCEAGATSFNPTLGPRTHLQKVKPNFTPTSGTEKVPPYLCISLLMTSFTLGIHPLNTVKEMDRLSTFALAVVPCAKQLEWKEQMGGEIQPCSTDQAMHIITGLCQLRGRDTFFLTHTTALYTLADAQ